MLVGTIVTRALGYRELLIHGEPLVYDRWRWLSARLPKTRGDERLIDIASALVRCPSLLQSVATASPGSAGMSQRKPRQHDARRCAAWEQRAFSRT